MKGSYGSVILSFHLIPVFTSISTFFTFSGNGLFSRAVSAVATKPPNSGISTVVPDGSGPLGRISLI